MSEITKAIESLCAEKKLKYEAVMDTIEKALAAAYRKDFGNKQQNIQVEFNPETGDMQVWDAKIVVEDIAEEVLEKAQAELTERREKAREENRELTEEEVEDLPRFNPKTELMIKDAKALKKSVKVGDKLEIDLEIPHDFGRMAAQTAKQVIIQKIREEERNMVFGDFKEQEGTLIMGTIQRTEGRKVLVDLGKITGLLLGDGQINNEHYRPGARMKFYVLKVEMGQRGPEVILSRSHQGMVREIFEQEIPEIQEGKIEIKGIARDAGFRSKVAVTTSDEAVDPIGSCIGQRGSRITTIIDEIGGEKIDVIQFSEDPVKYIVNALSPAKVVKVDLNEAEKIATVTVAEDQFSLTIGRGGQNVRLASELVGWKIDVAQEGEASVAEVKEQVGEKNNALQAELTTNTSAGEEEKNNEQTEKLPAEEEEKKENKKEDPKDEAEKEVEKDAKEAVAKEEDEQEKKESI